MKILVYSANFGLYDKVHIPLVKEPFTYLYYSDTLDGQELPVWDTIYLFCGDDPKREAGRLKTSSHSQPEHDISVWVDASLRFEKNLSPLVQEFILSGADVAMCPHRVRNCTYEEARACIKAGRDDPDVIRRHVDRYRKLNFPANKGMLETTFILRKNTPKVEKFNEFWSYEIERGSKRDQLSVMFAERQTGVKIHRFPYRVNKNPYFTKTKHVQNPDTTVSKAHGVYPQA